MKLLPTCAALIAVASSFLAPAASAQAKLDPSKPDFTGIWHRVGYTGTVKPDKGALPLTAEAAKVYAAHKAAAAKGDKSHDLTSICLPEGLTRLMLKAEPFEILHRPGLVAFDYQTNRLVRVAYFGAKPSAESPEYYLGESAAKWDGNDLVIETQGFNDQTLIDDSGVPHGLELKVTEHLSLENGGKRLKNRMTIEDPETFTAPWTVTVNYDRMPAGYQMPEDVCAEHIGNTAPRSRGKQ
jgi:hypothetical protein